METHTPLFTCHWKLDKWLLGNPLSFHCVSVDGEYVQEQVYTCHIFKITNCRHPLGSFVKSFSVADRDDPGNFQEMSSEQAVFLSLVFDTSYLSLKTSFPINLAFWKKKENICNKLLC